MKRRVEVVLSSVGIINEILGWNWSLIVFAWNNTNKNEKGQSWIALGKI